MRHTSGPLLALLLSANAAAAPVARVLTEDPPLPGEPLDGWEALGPAPALPPEEVLDVDEAVALALRSHPDAQAAEAAIRVARGLRTSARSLPSPTWEVGVGGFDEDPRAVMLGAELDVTDVLLAPARARSAGPEVDAARARAEEVALRLAYEVRAAYYDHQAALAAWQAELRAVDALAASRDVARAQVAAGNAPTRELALREVAYEEARIRAAESELAVVATRERLARLVGAPPAAVSPALPAAPEQVALPEDLEEAAVAASLELRALDLAREAAQRRTALAAWEGLTPELEVFAEAEREGPEWETIAGLRVSVPLLAPGAGEIARRAAERDALDARRAAVEREVRSAAREAALRLASAHRRARHLEAVVLPARERALAETLRHYNAMQVGIDVLLGAWRDRVAAEITRADTLRELWTALAAVEALQAGARVDAPRAAASAAGAAIDESGGH